MYGYKGIVNKGREKSIMQIKTKYSALFVYLSIVYQ